MKTLGDDKNRMKYAKDNLTKARYYEEAGDFEKSKEFAIEEFKLKIIQGNLKMAEMIQKEFNLPFEAVNSYVLNALETNKEKGRHEIAARIGKIFKLSQDKYISSAIKAFENYIKM